MKEDELSGRIRFERMSHQPTTIEMSENNTSGQDWLEGILQDPTESGNTGWWETPLPETTLEAFNESEEVLEQPSEYLDWTAEPNEEPFEITEEHDPRIFRFFDLPIELREIVYEFAMDVDRVTWNLMHAICEEISFPLYPRRRAFTLYGTRSAILSTRCLLDMIGVAIPKSSTSINRPDRRLRRCCTRC